MSADRYDIRTIEATNETRALPRTDLQYATRTLEDDASVSLIVHYRMRRPAFGERGRIEMLRHLRQIAKASTPRHATTAWSSARPEYRAEWPGHALALGVSVWERTGEYIIAAALKIDGSPGPDIMAPVTQPQPPKGA